MSNSDIIGSREAARLMGISVSHFNRHVQDGVVKPVHKLPGLRGAYVFNRADVEALAAREVTA